LGFLDHFARAGGSGINISFDEPVLLPGFSVPLREILP